MPVGWLTVCPSLLVPAVIPASACGETPRLARPERHSVLEVGDVLAHEQTYLTRVRSASVEADIEATEDEPHPHVRPDSRDVHIGSLQPHVARVVRIPTRAHVVQQPPAKAAPTPPRVHIQAHDDLSALPPLEPRRTESNNAGRALHHRRLVPGPVRQVIVQIKRLNPRWVQRLERDQERVAVP